MAMVAFGASASVTASPNPGPPITKPQKQKQGKIARRRHSRAPQRTPAALSFVAVLSSTATGTAAAEAKVFSFPEEDRVSSLTEAEDAIGLAGDVVSKVWGFSLDVFKTLTDTLKPGLDVSVPILQSASNEAPNAASPVISDASKQANEALLSARVDPGPVLSAAQTVAGAAQQTTKIIDEVKPIASATVEKITSSDSSVVAVAAGALFVGYLFLPPIWSALSFNFCGYQGNLSAPQTLDQSLHKITYD